VATQSGDSGWITSGIVHEYPATAVAATKRASPQLSLVQASPVATVVSVEFVAKPSHAVQVGASVAAAIAATFQSTPAFAGCAIMVAHQEQRLVTVLTYWHGEPATFVPTESVRWVCELLHPYMDRKLRVQTMRSQLAVLPGTLSAQRAKERCVCLD
jgi:hypothetical protein